MNLEELTVQKMAEQKAVITTTTTKTMSVSMVSTKMMTTNTFMRRIKLIREKIKQEVEVVEKQITTQKKTM